MWSRPIDEWFSGGGALLLRLLPICWSWYWSWLNHALQLFSERNQLSVQFVPTSVYFTSHDQQPKFFDDGWIESQVSLRALIELLSDSLSVLMGCIESTVRLWLFEWKTSLCRKLFFLKSLTTIYGKILVDAIHSNRCTLPMFVRFDFGAVFVRSSGRCGRYPTSILDLPDHRFSAETLRWRTKLESGR